MKAQPRSLSPSERRAYQLGLRCFERGEDARALSELTRLLSERPDLADVHYVVGILHERSDEMVAAARSLRRALQINPAYAEARLALASVYERQGDFERARKLNERTPTRPSPPGAADRTTRGKLANLQARLADAYREAGELREAIEGYRKALDRCPDFHDIRLRLASALRDSGLPAQALTELRRVERACPDLLEAAVERGLVLYTMGRAPDAARAWREVLSRDPAQARARMYLRMVEADAATPA